MENKSAQSQIDKMIMQYGLSSEYQLCDHLGVSQSTISKWKSRNSVPSQYIQKAEAIYLKKQECARLIDEVKISAADIADVLGVTLNRFYQVRKKKSQLCDAIEAGLKLQKSL